MPPKTTAGGGEDGILPTMIRRGGGGGVTGKSHVSSRADDGNERGRRARPRQHQRWSRVYLFSAVSMAALALFLAVRSGGGGLRGNAGSGGGFASMRSGARSKISLPTLTLPTTHSELATLNAHLSTLPTPNLLRWLVHSAFPHFQIIQVTSFGPTGLVILHQLQVSELLGEVPIVTVDTLHLFEESYRYYEVAREAFPEMGLRIVRPRGYDDADNGDGSGDGENNENINHRNNQKRTKEFDEEYTPDLWRTDPEKYGYLTKIEPLETALKSMGARAWMTGRRRDQGGERAELEVLEWYGYDDSGNDGGGSDRTTIDTDAKNDSDAQVDRSEFDPEKGRWKINPLAYWSHSQVWEYLRKHQIPYSPLYDEGYASIGDMTTTQKTNSKPGVGTGEDERSGRFVGLNQTECGMHSHLLKIQMWKEETAERGEVWEVPVLECGACLELTPENFERVIVPEEGVHPKKKGKAAKKKNGGVVEDNGSGDLLIEFYSPYCGSCQEFAPTLRELAEILSSTIDASGGDGGGIGKSSNADERKRRRKIRVARFDITEHDIPKIGGEDMFEIEVTPALYWVKRQSKSLSSSMEVDFYEGDHELDSILTWLKWKTVTD